MGEKYCCGLHQGCCVKLVFFVLRGFFDVTMGTFFMMMGRP